MRTQIHQPAPPKVVEAPRCAFCPAIPIATRNGVPACDDCLGFVADEPPTRVDAPQARRAISEA